MPNALKIYMDTQLALMHKKQFVFFAPWLPALSVGPPEIHCTFTALCSLTQICITYMNKLHHCP